VVLKARHRESGQVVAIKKFKESDEDEQVRKTALREVRILKDLRGEIAWRDVLVVEDIVDTGLTMSHLTELLGTRHPKSLRICSLLDKPSRRKVTVDIAYTGFSIPDEFVVGYGLDYAEKYRTLKGVAVLSPDVYS
jgi:hypoxanthine phosphoribosyltransferase